MSAATADLTKLIQQFSKAGDDINTVASNVINQAAKQIMTESIAMAPVRTGKLKHSITMTNVSTVKIIIGPHVPYGVFQEFGTGTRGEFPTKMYQIRPKKSKYLVFQVNGKTIRTTLVNHPGIPAHPYMRPAAEKVMNEIAPDLAKQGALLITKGPNA